MQPTVVPNFISKEDAEYLNKYLKSKSTMNPHNLLNVALYPVYLNNYEDGQKAHELVEFVIYSVLEKFELEDLDVSRAMYQILQKGDELGYHTDAYGGVDGYDEAHYSALVYLTDDYEGGEILFYDQLPDGSETSVAYKPEIGTLIYFKGDRNTPHSVNKVISGERSNIILFYKRLGSDE